MMRLKIRQHRQTDCSQAVQAKTMTKPRSRSTQEISSPGCACSKTAAALPHTAKRALQNELRVSDMAPTAAGWQLGWSERLECSTEALLWLSLIYGPRAACRGHIFTLAACEACFISSGADTEGCAKVQVFTGIDQVRLDCGRMTTEQLQQPEQAVLRQFVFVH